MAKGGKSRQYKNLKLRAKYRILLKFRRKKQIFPRYFTSYLVFSFKNLLFFSPLKNKHIRQNNWRHRSRSRPFDIFDIDLEIEEIKDSFERSRVERDEKQGNYKTHLIHLIKGMLQRLSEASGHPACARSNLRHFLLISTTFSPRSIHVSHDYSRCPFGIHPL